MNDDVKTEELVPDVTSLLAGTLRGGAKVTDTHLKMLGESIEIDGTKTRVHCYRLPIDANGRVRFKPLAEFLRARIIDYAIPRRRIEEAKKSFNDTGSTALVSKLENEAQKLFTSLSKSGEGGELLIFAFAEAVFGLSQVICKMSLKTSTEMHYHGADGVYAEGTDAGGLNVYWGESKLYADPSDAVRDCLESLAPFLVDPDGSDSAKAQDIFLINEFADFDDPKLSEGLKRYFDLDDGKSLSLKHCGIALIGFDTTSYLDDGLNMDEEALEAELQKQVPHWLKQIKNRVGKESINQYDIHFICVPMRTVAEFRDYSLLYWGTDMSLESVQTWLKNEEGIKNELDRLRAWSAILSFGDGVIRSELVDETHDWHKLLLAASILSESTDRESQECALMVAESAVCFSDQAIVQDAGSLILTRLSNHRAVQLAEERELLRPDIEQRVGMMEQLLSTRRRLSSQILVNETTTILGNRFQTELWSKLTNSEWLTATAPTAAGKTYAVLNWLLSQHATGISQSSVFVAPTRALVSEVERQLNELKLVHGLNALKVTSLPINEADFQTEPFIAVFTQERLHIFLNAGQKPHRFDVAIVDEAQKLSDERRGVILQDAIERVARANGQCKFVFLSPHSDNPEVLLEGAPEGAVTAIVPSNTATVMQNLLVAEQVRGNTKEWTLSLSHGEGLQPLGTFSLFDRPTSVRKRMAFVALALGKETSGTLVYVTTADSAERIATQIYDGLGDEEQKEDSDLNDLSDFCKKMIHPKFQLVHLVKRGVAFHYGNMPSILREEIERLFTVGKLRFLVSTSTLIEGVNLACRTIIIRGPKKGIGRDMSPQDFWNLAGRAGRWGADFYGNIVCVDVSKADVWPQGLPKKTAYPIRRETDQVIDQFDNLSQYLSERSQMRTDQVDGKLEHVAAYLMNWMYREGSLSQAPPIKKIGDEVALKLEELIRPEIEAINVSQEIADAMTCH